MNNFSNHEYVQAAADEMMIEMTVNALTLYMQALDEKTRSPGAIWLASEQMQRRSKGYEPAMWFRLGAEPVLNPGIDNFDVGVVVDSDDVEEPIPTEFTEDEKRFYVRSWSAEHGPFTEIITKENVLLAAQEKPARRNRLPVYDLNRKLGSYYLHVIGVGSISRVPRGEVA